MLRYLRVLSKRHFDLFRDKEDHQKTYESIRVGTEFRGTNLWILICAIFVASLGLNMNSTAVIIGAMLISPLMGPIMGVGFGVGVMDPNLIKKSFRNLVVATLIGMLTSCVYFLLTPINDMRSELLARTTPNIYDVMIAFFGGMAGIIATGSKEKGNVIPGVAIATALMPPLCTSGYGLATAQWSYFFGAFYLYLINCVYIGFATWLGVYLLKIPKRPFTDVRKHRKLVHATTLIVLLTAIPSIFITWKIFTDNILLSQAKTFISKEFNYKDTHIIDQKYEGRGSKKSLELSLIGRTLPQDSINDLIRKMSSYGLKDVELQINQGYEKEQKIDQEGLSRTIMMNLLKYNENTLAEQQKQIASLEMQLATYQKYDSVGTNIARELRILFPQIRSVTVANTHRNTVDSLCIAPVTMALVTSNKTISTSEKSKLEAWLSERLSSNCLKLIIEQD